MPDTDSPTRRPYTGSCHCGATRYVVFLTLPHVQTLERTVKQNFYRCNCTLCHKGGVFHIRLPSSPDDFLLLSPLDPYNDLGDYTTGAKALHQLFCKTCGVKCFIFAGDGEHVDVDLGDLGVAGHVAGKTVTAWRPKKDGWQEGGGPNRCYLSVNGYTVDAKQEGFDLAEITGQKGVVYIDFLRRGEEGMGQPGVDRPHKDGAY